MAAHTVRLDEDSGEILEELVEETGLPIQDLLRQGLLALRQQLPRPGRRHPYEIYQELDLGPGGYAIAPSTETRRGVQEAIRRKIQR